MEEKNNIQITEDDKKTTEIISEKISNFENENVETLIAIKNDINEIETVNNWNNIDDTIKLIDSEVIKAEQVYESKSYNKMTKKQLVIEYNKVCSDKSVNNRLTENMLKKTKKSEIIDLIMEINGGNNKNTDNDINRKTNFINDVPATQKQISQSEKTYLAKGLYNLNLMATYSAEKLNGMYKKQTGVDIDGLSIELAQPKAQKDQMPIFISMVEQYPVISSYLGNAMLQYSAYMTKMGVQRAAHNDKFFPKSNTPKSKRNNVIPKNNVVNPSNLSKNKKETGWITVRGKKIRDPSTIFVPIN